MVPRFNIPRLSSRSASRSEDLRPSSSSTLTEALRTNPFRSKSSEDVREDDTVHLHSLNESLVKLAALFSDVKIEVLRELLLRYDGESRLEISIEQLFRYKAEWARGRYSVPPRETGDVIAAEDLFRSQEYLSEVKRVLRLEFRSLSRSTIDGVLAEVNSSYTRARPILQDLSRQSWTTTFSNMFRKKKPQDEPPLCLFEKRRIDYDNPQLQPTGSMELDRELGALFVEPIRLQGLNSRESTDLAYAHALNLQEAEEAGALFECQVCYNEVAFESICSCSTGSHDICFDCIRHTMYESVFGQGKAKSVDTGRCTLKCVAPSSYGECAGYLPQTLVRQAILLNKAGREMWTKFEERLAEDAMQASQLPLVRCPFCSYAEIDHTYDPNDHETYEWYFKKPKTLATFWAVLFLFNLIPWLLCIMIPMFIVHPLNVTTMIRRALHNASLRHRQTRFQCQNQACKRASCLKCQKSWHDPHICHEPLLVSLRTTVEAARTAAVKRTCPRCGTSFVKESGCNKLTCVCGYAMCYLCRNNIGKSGEGGSEGYRHFCEHFRPNPGKPCAECNKCDLYRAENEDAVVRQAGLEAEREWRIKEGMVGVQGLEEATKGTTDVGFFERLASGNWEIQDLVNMLVDKTLVVKS